jgi:hypothetical protein
MILTGASGERMKRSLLGAIALGAGSAAVSGFGHSVGRDLWKSTRNSSLVIIFLLILAGAVSLPFLGARNLVRGHAPGEWVRTLGDVLMIAAGAAVAFCLAVLATATLDEDTSRAIALLLLGGMALAILIGLMFGATQRGSSQRRYAIAARNERFLERFGITETGEREITHYDGEGNALRVAERTPDSIVLTAVGKRNKRAYIALTPDGEMIGYTGVVPIGESRNYRRDGDSE